MVLFNWGWSRLINKLSLIRSLNLFASEARILKWSKSIEQLYSSRWSDTADCLTHLRCFPVKLEISMYSAESNLKFCKLKSFFNHHASWIRCSVIKIPFRKRSTLTLFTDTCVVTARLLIMVKHTATFLLELQSTWGFLI